MGLAWPVGAQPTHSRPCTGSSIGLKGPVQVAKTMAGAVYGLVSDPALIDETKKVFMVRRGGKAYCSIEKLLG